MNFRIVNGSVSFGAETILEEINFEIKDKEKIAIVGRNGAGKSTLLNAIINNDLLSEGIGKEKFAVYKQGLPKIGYLKQFNIEEDVTLIDEILKSYKDVVDLEKKIESLVTKMQENSSEELAKEYSKAVEKYELLNGYTYKKEYETVISKFGFSKDDKYKKISEFSGGQRTKIAFIKLLLSKPDILLLDEPTNHLDINTIEWLENYLKNYLGSVVIVSHDRMFLDNIVDKVYEIEYGTIVEYSGNYTFFEKQKRINYEKQLKDYEYQQKEIKRLTDIADRFRYKPTKAKMAMSKLKQIERMVKIKVPNRYDLNTFKTNFKVLKESGNNCLHIDNLKIGYNNNVLNTISCDIYKGQKVAIIGSNGTGKSTLLKTIVGSLEPIDGKYKIGHNVEIGYFDQQMALLNSKKTVIEEFSEEFPKLTTTELHNSLAAFMFYGEDVNKKIDMLSGGEKVRLELCEILKKGPNLLILDEPTNHMDIVGKESLESLLKEYDGTILFVSHDRFSVNKVADSLIIFEKEKVNYFKGTYSEYIEKKNKENNIEKAIDKNENNKEYIESNNINKKEVYNNNPLKEKNRLAKKIEKIEIKVSEMENKVSMLEKELLKEDIFSDYVKVQEIQEKIDLLKKQIDQDMNVWEELEEEYNLIKI